MFWKVARRRTRPGYFVCMFKPFITGCEWRGVSVQQANQGRRPDEPWNVMPWTKQLRRTRMLDWKSWRKTFRCIRPRFSMRAKNGVSPVKKDLGLQGARSAETESLFAASRALSTAEKGLCLCWWKRLWAGSSPAVRPGISGTEGLWVAPREFPSAHLFLSSPNRWDPAGHSVVGGYV